MFIILVAIVSFFSFDPLRSYFELFKTITILFSFQVFYQVFFKVDFRETLRISSKVILVITVLNFIVSNIYGVGWAGYSSEAQFYTGALFANSWYTAAFAFVILMIEIVSGKNTRTDYIFAAIGLLAVLISARRSAFVIIIIGIIIILLTSSSRYKLVILGSSLVIFILLFSPFYSDYLEAQFYARQERIESGIESEGRYLETVYVWSEILQMNDIMKSFFGRNPFITAGEYGGGALGNRLLHVDINIIVFSAGLIGLLLYFSIYGSIIGSFLSTYNYSSKRFKNKGNYYLQIFSAVIISSIMLSFSGGLNALTYRMFTFQILAGSIAGLISEYEFAIDD